MSVQALQDDAGAPSVSKAPPVGAQVLMQSWLKSIGPFGPRVAVTGVGAVFALALGVGAARMVQLPPEIKDPPAAQEQTLALSELPYETAARDFALQNPPTSPTLKEASLSQGQSSSLDSTNVVATDDAQAEPSDAVDPEDPASQPSRPADTAPGAPKPVD